MLKGDARQRSQQPCAIAAIIVNVSNLITDFPEISEMDLIRCRGPGWRRSPATCASL